MKIKKVISFVLVMTFVVSLLGNSSAVFADPEQNGTNAEIVPSAPTLEELETDDDNNYNKNKITYSNVICKGKAGDNKSKEKGYTCSTQTYEEDISDNKEEAPPTYEEATSDDQEEPRESEQSWFPGCENDPEREALYQAAAEANVASYYENNENAGNDELPVRANNPYMTEAYKEAMKAKRSEENMGLFGRIKNSTYEAFAATKNKINEICDIVDTAMETISDNEDVILNTVAAGATATGLYGLYSLRNKGIKRAGLLATLAVAGVWGCKTVEFIKNEWNYYQKGKELPQAAQRERFPEFEKNVVGPVESVIVGASMGAGVYFCPVATLKFVVPIVSSNIIRNRMDRYFKESNWNQCVSGTIGFGVGSLISPVAMVGSALDMLNSLVKYYFS